MQHEVVQNRSRQNSGTHRNRMKLMAKLVIYNVVFTNIKWPQLLYKITLQIAANKIFDRFRWVGTICGVILLFSKNEKSFPCFCDYIFINIYTGK